MLNTALFFATQGKRTEQVVHQTIFPLRVQIMVWERHYPPPPPPPPPPPSPLQVRSVAPLISQGAAVGTSEVEELVPHEGRRPLSLEAVQVEEPLTLVALHREPLVLWLHCLPAVPTLQHGHVVHRHSSRSHTTISLKPRSQTPFHHLFIC